MLIVSNTAGTDSDKNFAEANLLENATGVKVFRHSTKVSIRYLFFFLDPLSSYLFFTSRIALLVCPISNYSFFSSPAPDPSRPNPVHSPMINIDPSQKPGCHPQILSHLISCPDSGVTHASQIAIVGDRLFTDVMMANMMGSHAIWVRDGVVGRGFVSIFSFVLTRREIVRTLADGRTVVRENGGPVTVVVSGTGLLNTRSDGRKSICMKEWDLKG